MSLDNRTGELAQHFSLKDNHGKEVHLEDFEGRWLWLVFHRHLG